MEGTDKSIEKPWLFKKGNRMNPLGRPKGKTIKERVREWLETHPEDMKGFVKHFVKENRDLAWRMLEGNPKQSIDGGEDKEGNPIPILGGLTNVHSNDSPKENPES